MRYFLKDLIIIWIILLFPILCFPQNISPFTIKEQYDKRQKSLIENGPFNTCLVGNNTETISSTYGDGVSYILESYLKMYDSTKDKAYLIKFILNTICMHEHRLDVLGTYSVSEPRWACKDCPDENGNPVDYQYHDGLIIWPMSHFVHLVKIQEPYLYELSLPQITGTKISNNHFGNNLWSTYGEFAEWLRIRIKQTLDYYTYGNSQNNFANYWGNDTKCFTPTTDQSDRAQSVNKQTGFGCALFYLGATDQNSEYLQKVAQIALAYKGTWNERNPHPTFSCLFGGVIHTHPVLKLLSNNSYVWKTNGWRERICSEHNNGTTDFEDISHAVQTLIFPLAIHNRLESNNVMLFNDNDLVRFRNTFSFNIYAGTISGCPRFHAGIDGDDEITYGNSYSFNTLRIRSLAWMPFYKFDFLSSNPNVYDIIMDYYACDVLDNINNISYGLDFYGLSEVVAAQWDKECVNLKLYNRKIIYDQNFYVKNKLEIIPEANDGYHSMNDPSFAEPIIFENEFTIEPGVTVNVVVGENIRLKPGFLAKKGSTFSASLITTICSDGFRMAHYGNEGQNDSSHLIVGETVENKFYLDSILNQETRLNRLTIQPNPSNGVFYYSLPLSEQIEYEILVTNSIGQLIFKSVRDLQSGSIDLTDKLPGVYLFQAKTQKEVFSYKIVIM